MRTAMTGRRITTASEARVGTALHRGGGSGAEGADQISSALKDAAPAVSGNRMLGRAGDSRVPPYCPCAGNQHDALAWLVRQPFLHQRLQLRMALLIQRNHITRSRTLPS